MDSLGTVRNGSKITPKVLRNPVALHAMMLAADDRVVCVTEVGEQKPAVQADAERDQSSDGEHPPPRQLAGTTAQQPVDDERPNCERRAPQERDVVAAAEHRTRRHKADDRPDAPATAHQAQRRREHERQRRDGDELRPRSPSVEVRDVVGARHEHERRRVGQRSFHTQLAGEPEEPAIGRRDRGQRHNFERQDRRPSENHGERSGEREQRSAIEGEHRIEHTPCCVCRNSVGCRCAAITCC